jgi:hypothetical protein
MQRREAASLANNNEKIAKRQLPRDRAASNGSKRPKSAADADQLEPHNLLPQPVDKDVQYIEHRDYDNDDGVNFDAEWGGAGGLNSDELERKYPIDEPDLHMELGSDYEYEFEQEEDVNNWNEEDANILGFPEIVQAEVADLEPVPAVPPVYPGNNYICFFGENTRATSGSFTGTALKFRDFFIEMLRGTRGSLTYFIYNLPIFIAILVLLLFTGKNGSYASGNLVCVIVAKIFAVFSIEFPKTITALLHKLGVVNSKHNDLEVKVACKICSKVYDSQDCMIADPSRRGQLMSKVCTDSVLHRGEKCNESLLQHTLGRTGEKIYHSLPTQRYVCPGN